MRLPSFPNPVNETSARVVAAGVVAMATGTVALGQPWLLLPLTYGFAARVVAGPSLSPLGLLATRVVTPLVPVAHRYSPGPPKRMAQGMGLAMSSTAAVLAATGRRKASSRVVAVLAVAAGLEAFLGVCLGCKVFAVLMRLGVIPAAVCASCNDIWSRFPGGRDRGA